MFAAEFEPERSDNRSAPRIAVDFTAPVIRDGYDRALCQVVNISLRGARLQTYTPLERGQVIRLTLPKLGQVAATVMWTDDYVVGCRFDHPLADADYETLTVA